MGHKKETQPSDLEGCVSFIFKKIPRSCRVLQSSEPAKAGRAPTRQFGLGLSLSRHCREIGSLFMGVGSERKCSIAYTAGQDAYTTKSRA